MGSGTHGAWAHGSAARPTGRGGGGPTCGSCPAALALRLVSRRGLYLVTDGTPFFTVLFDLFSIHPFFFFSCSVQVIEF